MTKTPLKTLQSRVDQWIQTYGVRYFAPTTNMILLVEEVGELARGMARTYGEQSYKASEKEGKEALAEEMADILFVLLCLANQMHIDLDEAFAKSLSKKTKRDTYRHRENPNLR